MSAKTGWFSGRRLLVFLGVGLLLLLAWYGGRLSAGEASPFDLMGENMHGGAMMEEGHMHGGGAMMEGAGADSGGTFDGEAGLQRCRAMMGTMSGMHRSMQSMMGPDEEGSSGTTERRGHMGMMGRGGMGQGMGPMDERMHEDMSPGHMRRLCRTMHESMRAVMHGPMADSLGNEIEEALGDESLAEETEQWLRGARGFEGIEDRTGESEVVVEVGAGDGLQYAPVAVRVDPGTTIRWRWTGRGGLHDVAFLNAGINTSLREEEGAEFVHTFNAPGEYRYECTPHSGVGMRGVVIVSES